ncbi:uridine kinase [Antricoccus suffuscus]|uniref:Uridine kinase n=1 Tax=Antricoccus suffuscus TaxID=1629062 RepID=A0A2T0ZGF3_9ACTN|nr:uridine kinase [Antricoccus suffuscus]
MIVLAGPSGSGKSRLADRLGQPILRLDDFYRDGEDPMLPRHGAHADWESPAAWHGDRALDAILRLCAGEQIDVPIYSMAANRAVGSRPMSLDGAPFLVVEGLFTSEVVAPIRVAGLLAAAVVLRNNPLLTFVRRMRRDFADGRKPPRDIVRIGVGKLARERSVVRALVAAGGTPMSNPRAMRYLGQLITSASVKW